MAVTDCGGQGSACATDLTGLASSLAAATASVSSAVDDCKSGSFLKCVGDVASAAKSIASVSASIAKAAKDCGSSELVELTLSDSPVAAAPPLTVTNSIDGDVFFNVTTGTPGTCTCESPACQGGGATGHRLMKGDSQSFKAAPTCQYYAVGGGIVAKDGRTCHTWRADFNSCGVYDGHTDGECARISNATCHVIGTATTLLATVDSKCDALPYAQCQLGTSKCCGPNVCAPSKPGSSYLMCQPSTA